MPVEDLQNLEPGESSEQIRKRVICARQIQLARQGKANAELQGKELGEHCWLGNQQRKLLADAITRLNLSARVYDRTLRVARTIADMQTCEKIEIAHISEALGYRNLDRKSTVTSPT